MKSWSRVWMSALMGLCLVALVRPASAQYRQNRPEGEPSVNQLPQQLEDIGIEDKAGGDIPRDIALTHSDGSKATTGDYMTGDKPLVIVLAYYRCPMLCSLVLNGLNGAMKGIEKKTAGKDYRVLVVSFDPRDTTEIAREKRDNYVHAYGREVDTFGYDYTTTDEASVKRLAGAIGFRYRWDEKTQQFAHAAGLFVVTPQGKLSQVLTGIQFKGEELDHALEEASRGGWHSPFKSALLYCFTYDPKSGSYVPIVRNIMKAGGALTIAVIGALLFVMFRRERARAAARGAEPLPLSAAGDLPAAGDLSADEPLAPSRSTTDTKPTPAGGQTALAERATT